MKCKCGRQLNECQACKGRGNTGWTTCSKCRNTGLVCITHGGHWK